MGFDDERVSQLLAGRRAVQRYDFPGTERDEEPLHVGIRVLSDAEYDTARCSAQFYLEKCARRASRDEAAFLRADPDFLQRETIRQALSIAVRDPESDGPFFASVEQVRKLDGVTISRLWAIYNDHEDQIAPLVNLDEEQVAQLRDALKKGQGARSLAAFAPATLRSLVRSLVSQSST